MEENTVSSHVPNKKTGFWHTLVERRIPQILGTYFGISLGLFQLTQWLVRRYKISPHWEEICLFTLILMAPTVFLLAYHHGQPGKNRWVSIEKIGIPVNVLLVCTLLFLGFRNKDLGRTTETITIEDTEGNTIEREIAKSSFRKRLGVFFFKNNTGDSGLDWLQFGLPTLLTRDLSQDLFLSLNTAYEYKEHLQKAGFASGIGIPLGVMRDVAQTINLTHFADGQIQKTGDTYRVSTRLFDTKRGKSITEPVFEGTDLFALVDDMSVAIKQDLGIPEGHIETAEDLPITELMTSSLPALEQMVLSNNAATYETDIPGAIEYSNQAIAEDPSFAWAYFNQFVFYQTTGRSDLALASLQQAQKHNYRLTEREGFIINANLALLNQDMEGVLKTAQHWTIVYPDDIMGWMVLGQVYRLQNESDKLLETYEQLLELDPTNTGYLTQLATLHREKGNLDQALTYLNQYQEQNPNTPTAYLDKGRIYRIQGDFDAAQEVYDQALVIDPQNFDAAFEKAGLQLRLGQFDAAQTAYLDLLEKSRTSTETNQTLYGLESFHRRLGQWKKAAEYADRRLLEVEKTTTPVLFSDMVVGSIESYVKAGQAEQMLNRLNKLEAAIPLDVSGPNALNLVFAFHTYYLQTENLELAKDMLDRFESLIDAYGLDLLRDAVTLARGRLALRQDQNEEAAQHFETYLANKPTILGVSTLLGRAYTALGQFEKAEAAFQRSLKQSPESALLHYYTGVLYHKQNDQTRARKHLTRATETWVNADEGYDLAEKARTLLAELDV